MDVLVYRQYCEILAVRLELGWYPGMCKTCLKGQRIRQGLFPAGVLKIVA